MSADDVDEGHLLDAERDRLIQAQDGRWAQLGWLVAPRLTYRLRFGRWCAHPAWTVWWMWDLGRVRSRLCVACGYAQHVGG